MDEEEPSGSGEEGCSSISTFDYSVENHLKAVDSITDLCGEASNVIDKADINRLSSSVTFLREWRHLSYESKRFVFYNDEAGKSCEPKGIISHTLPQFSSARAPKVKIDDDESSSSFGQPSKDFIMHVGGSVWALEWCPRVHGNPDARAKCEFLAVATHPPDSYSHKIGVRLSGRGIIQIWCIINATCEDDSIHISGKKHELTRKSQKKPPDGSNHNNAEPKRPRGRPRKHPIETTEPKKPKGRPRKKTTAELPIELDGDVLYVEALSVRYPDESVVPATPLRETSVTKAKTNNESSGQVLSSENANIKLPVRRKRQKAKQTEETCEPVVSEDGEAVGDVPGGQSSDISEDIALPRVVLCLAHNGKVVWDMKWRPPSADDSLNKHRMGYLAVLLGNGSLEVWDVPMPQAVSAVYLSSKKDATDPRFVKLAPVFRCSNLKCGDTQSIPLTVEWSTIGNPDFLLAGCHDGTVALWKFSTTKSSEDTRPLLLFSADTAPIRAVAWAPGESAQESSNVVATAGHGGMKFWDLRDPFRPLWDLHPVPRFIYSLDWLQDPKCVLLSFDDGTIRILSLVKVAYDVPSTGRPYPNTKQQGLSVYNCSSFPIWSIQVSRHTGMAAYCTADGSVFHFQLTTKAVEKDSRNRPPHFLCGRLTMNYSTFTVHSSVPNVPIFLKKPVSEAGEKQRCLRSLLNESPNRHASPVSDAQPLAFAHDEDPGFESETGGTSNKGSKSKAQKGKNNTIEEDEHRGALVCATEDGHEEGGRRKEASDSSSSVKAETFPPKMVAMHRVRWNMNKGSERWLCYGGAAGIVRCQEIASSGLVGKQNRRPQKM
ncbi:Transducin/WD40 repeat-like superfamily protein [Hirschfeldia incana]|nr:Transducin/WD40 repeat-like superfamily protein [Hirschfeldia incana]